MTATLRAAVALNLSEDEVVRALELLSAEQAPAAPGGREPELGWLVERVDVSPPLYLSLDAGKCSWTRDSIAALRLARRRDAVEAGRLLAGRAPWEAREHAWTD